MALSEMLITALIGVVNLYIIAKVAPRWIASIRGYFDKRRAIAGKLPAALEAAGTDHQLEEWTWLVSELRSFETSLRRAPGLVERVHRFPSFYFGMNDGDDLYQAQQRVLSAVHACAAPGVQVSAEQHALLNELVRVMSGDARKLKLREIRELIARAEGA